MEASLRRMTEASSDGLTDTSSLSEETIELPIVCVFSAYQRCWWRKIDKVVPSVAADNLADDNGKIVAHFLALAKIGPSKLSSVP